MKFSISFKYSNVTFKNKETKETISYDTKAEGNTFTFDNVDEDVVLGIVKGIKDRKASQVFAYDDFRTNFINVMARNKCKELYDKLDKGGWKVEDIAISNITIKDLEFTKPTMNAREVITVESRKMNEDFKDTMHKQNQDDLTELNNVVFEVIKELDRIDDGFDGNEFKNMDAKKLAKRLSEIRWKLHDALPSTKTAKKMGWSESGGGVPKEPVIFRKDRDDGEVIAFFPETLRDGSCNPGHLMSYAHNGQHSEASIYYYLKCKPCSEEEYADLLTELEGIYTDGLRVMRRMACESVNDAAYALDDPEYMDKPEPKWMDSKEMPDGTPRKQNKRGVYWHEYEVKLANGTKRTINPYDEYDWGDVEPPFGGEWYDNTIIKSKVGKDGSRRPKQSPDNDDFEKWAWANTIGLVLNETDQVEIVWVKDTESGKTWKIETDSTPYDWAEERIYCYDECYV